MLTQAPLAHIDQLPPPHCVWPALQAPLVGAPTGGAGGGLAAGGGGAGGGGPSVFGGGGPSVVGGGAGPPLDPQSPVGLPSPEPWTWVPGFGNLTLIPSGTLQVVIWICATNILGRASKAPLAPLPPIVALWQRMYISRLPTRLNQVL